MKSMKERYLRHQFRDEIFVNGHENDPYSPNMLNYSLSCSKKCRWSEGMLLNNFVQIRHNCIMYHSTVRVGKLIRQNDEWVGDRKEIENFLTKVPLDENGEPIDKGFFIFNGEYVENSQFNYGDIVEWGKDRAGRTNRHWVSKLKPVKLSTDRFEYVKQPTDILVPYSELEKMLRNKRIVDLLRNNRGLYMWTDDTNEYIGSAGSQNGGLHSRILDYFDNGHGGNKKLILENKDNPEFLKKCKFKILSVFPPDYDLNDIQRAEANMKKLFNCSWN